MFKRRDILFYLGASTAYPALLTNAACAQQPGRPALPLPPLIDARAHDNAIRLTAQTGRHAFRPGRPTATLGYSGAILGPVIRMHRGDDVAVSVENQTDTATTVHWHGLLVPSDRDGGPHNPIAPGDVWTRTLPIRQAEATAWFHPHPHRDTSRQVYFGFAGMVLIEDGTGARLGLPHTYGEDDIPLILQDRLFNAYGDLIYPDGPMTVMTGARGDTIIVNGAINPVARVPAGVVRLRCLNGSNARTLDLGFADRRAFSVIASDAGYLSAPVETTSLLVAPGERYEILVNFSNGRPADLVTGADPYPPMMMGMMRGRGGGPGAVMRFAPDRERRVSVSSMPSTLIDAPPLPSLAGITRRRFVLNDMSGMMGGMMGRGAGFGINGQAFAMERIDAEAALGSSEVWEIVTQAMAHPFHVHGAHFRILSLDGAPPPPHMHGWKDTVLTPRSAEVLIHFTQLAPRDDPFMFHCHILEHEDNGMMGQYICV